MNRSFWQLLRPLNVVFVIITLGIVVGGKWLESKSVDQTALLAGNLIIFAATLCSMLLVYRGTHSSNPQATVRSLYLSFMIKFFVIAITAFVYIMANKKDVNKPALVACAGLYIIYTWFEVSALMKTLKKKQNA
jgi:ACR3 family arsenite efflux pump ArsB